MSNSGATAKRVLVVEDEPAISQVCQRILTGEELEVDIAVNGRIAQGMLTEKEYHLLLVDIRTPEMNGQELYEYISRNYPELKSRVIFTTGDVIARDTATFLEEAGRPCLLKPFTPDELKGLVRKAIEELEE
jgi:CheY-like chemotaxis protein